MDTGTVQIISVLIAAILVFSIVWLFKKRATSISLKLLDAEFEVPLGEARGALQQLIDELMFSVKELDDVDRKLFDIVRAVGGQRTVEDITKDVFSIKQAPAFVRSAATVKSEPHEHFRKLRNLKLIRPAGGGPWQGTSRPMLTRFVQLILRIKPNAFD